MRLFSRRDRLLLIGLTAAVSVIFARRLSRLLDVARQDEQGYGLALIPGLIILTVVFLMHQLARRQEIKAEAAAAASAAREAEARARDLEMLITFGQSLARSLDLDSIRDVLLQHMPELAGTPDVWAMLRTSTLWDNLIPSTRIPTREIDAGRTLAAEQAIAQELGGRNERDGIEIEGQVVFPMLAGGNAIGALGVSKGAPLTGSRRRMLAAAASLLAVSVKNAQLFRDTRENSLRDGLTGCVNRTHGVEMTEVELRRARRSRLPLSVIMFDLDHFKAINDRHGHLCGDTVLSTVGRRMQEVLRGSDVKCRYGGEEFLVVLPETPLEGARRVAEILRKELADTPVGWNGVELHISASFGVTAAHAAEIETPMVIARADSALYCAKSDGRNCVRVAVDSMTI
ncbi:MAG TPA: GGDEF domain-containing protein [Vicinamibacterales bacterium]|nr:GGDEF domain-containing protein [Vicinamibacterales bacterium]